jgi:hypothetical protein
LPLLTFSNPTDPNDEENDDNSDEDDDYDQEGDDVVGHGEDDKDVIVMVRER